MKHFARKLVDRLTRRLAGRLDSHDETLLGLVEANLRTRAMLKRATGQPIHVLFACHMPALWSMFESVYRAISGDPGFTSTVLALPYAHPTLPPGQYKDEGVYHYLKAKGVNVLQGYDKETNQWATPGLLSPDYVFFQTPYNQFPPMWSVERVAIQSRVCYTSYGTTISSGEVESLIHPERFMRHVSLFFTECKLKADLFEKKFGRQDWFDRRRVVVSGSPKFDYLASPGALNGRVWKRGMRDGTKRILWTPRWRTSEGNCHFFDYKDYFRDLCRAREDVDFVFRPHPLCLQNFIKTGEMSQEQVARMKTDYAASPNMAIDESGGYEDTFLTSDVLVSDFSSMLVEYFATGKPIIYTHRKAEFNEYGQRLSEGLYWVRSAAELDQTLANLLSGKDPLREKRDELMKELFYFPEGGSGRAIKEHLKAAYTTC